MRAHCFQEETREKCHRFKSYLGHFRKMRNTIKDNTAMFVSISFVMGNICLFTQACTWSKRTLDIVDSCPATKEGTIKAARNKRCDGIALRQNCTEPSKFKYHCLYSYREKEFVEVCSIETYIHGVCIVYDTNSSKVQPIYNVRCRDNSAACPERYLSTEGHLYATCPELMNLTLDDMIGTNNKPPVNENQNVNYLAVLLPISIIIIVISIIVLIIYKRRHICCKQRDGKRNDLELSERRKETTLLLSEAENIESGDESKSALPAESLQDRKFQLGDYRLWETSISDLFSTLIVDEVLVSFCFLCSDSSPPDFTDTEWLDMLNVIRQRLYRKKNPLTSEEAQQTLDRLKSRDFLWVDQTRKHLTGDARDEIMYRVSNRVEYINTVFYLSSFATAHSYLRSQSYSRKPREKCVIDNSDYNALCDPLLIRRLQMDILTHVTMEDTGIFDKVSEILNISMNIVKGSEKERGEFQEKLKQTGERVPNKGRSQDSVQHVKWLWRYGRDARPDIVRSCVGLHPHWDIYIIDNLAYRKSSQYHTYPSDVRCLLYCILLVDEYNLDVNEKSHKTQLNNLRERFFTDLPPCDEINLTTVPEGIIYEEEGKVKFKSEDVRHDVMYAFVTECLVNNTDMEYFLNIASRDVISEYCRTSKYERGDGERCLYVPNFPETMYDLFIDKLHLDIIIHCTMSDRDFHDCINKRLGVPNEVLRWDFKARERYVDYAKRGTQTVHHARGMIVGCAGAGKTTLLKRLMRCTEEELMNVTSTVGLEVHEEIFKINDDTNKMEALIVNEDDEKRSFNRSQNAKMLSFFDFGGQSAYYASHQIYLTRRAFYIVVMDASKCLDQKVDKAVCDQDGSVFSGWTYGDYFAFWIKSIHTYCGAKNEEDQKPVVLIVATHWDQKIERYKDEDDLMEILQRQLPRGSHLSQYIKRNNCYCIQFTVPLNELETHIANIASHSRWEESIPKEWAIFGIHLQETKAQRILNASSIEIYMYATENDDILPRSADDITMRKQDMLRFYHDAGKVLYFNEDGLKEFAIIDVQWFVDAFKNIITDKLHLKGLAATLDDWDDYYKTGNLRDRLLEIIWADSHSTKLHHKETVLNFMQRLGLVAIGRTSHYVPCMNRKEMDAEIQNSILQSDSKSSILVYRFEYLPFFFFFRLVVACMQEKGWEVPTSNGISHLYKNAALFAFEDCNVILSVTSDSIQLQVLHALSDQTLNTEKTREIQITVERLLDAIIGTFHRKIMFTIGIRCQEDKEKAIAMGIQGHFLEVKNIQWEEEKNQVCPLHRMKNTHVINAYELKKYWKF